MIHEIGKHKIHLYDSIHELPILRFQRFNKYQMQSIQVGSTFSDYDVKTQKVMAFLKHGMIEDAIQELENRRLVVFNALNSFTPSGKSFAVMVKQIDDVVYNKFTPDELDRCLRHLDEVGLPNGTAVEKLREVKKKSKLNYKFITQYIFQKR